MLFHGDKNRKDGKREEGERMESGSDKQNVEADPCSFSCHACFGIDREEISLHRKDMQKLFCGF